ncbi:MAG TPA: hypothetical protein VNF50_03375 [Acidimicrobiales bacterium]|nr:hypothetical protein [Acidimicrobiales bacterium]
MKTFRIGLRLGVLAGLGAAIYATMKARKPAGGGSTDATGVHGDWPAVTRRPPEASGDHHPHGRVAVPMEAAAMGAPPAVSDPVHPRSPEPEVPVPAEQLDRPDPHPGSLPHVPTPAPPAPAPAQPKAVAPVKKAAPRKAPAKKAAAAQTAAPPAKAAPPAAKKAPAPAAAKPAKAAPVKKPPVAKSAAPVRKKPPPARG